LLLILAAAGLSLSAALPVHADQPPAEPALKGPSVEDRKVPGVEGRFGEGGVEKNKLQSEQRIPPRVYRQALESLRNTEDQSVRLSADQEAKIQAHVEGFEKSMREFQEANRAKLDELRKARGEARDDDAGRGADARVAYRELMASAPKMEDTWTKVWAELTPAQQKAVDARLDEFRERASQMRQDQYVNRRMNRQGDQPGGRPPEGAPPRRPGRGGPEGRPGPEGGRGPEGRGPGGIDPQRRERLLRLFERLSPEQQDELLRRIEERAGGGGGPGRPPEGQPPRRRQRPQPPQPPEPPMPPMDEMSSPAPGSSSN
jgi:hypothetical protein